MLQKRQKKKKIEEERPRQKPRGAIKERERDRAKIVEYHGTWRRRVEGQKWSGPGLDSYNVDEVKRSRGNWRTFQM